jgi:hypothetical protein
MADNKQEITIIQNTLSLLRKGSYSLSGDEALIFHQCFSYLVDKHKLLSKPPQQILATTPEPTTTQSKPKKGK